MKPANRLRFVERRVYVNKPAYNSYGDRGEVSELVKKMILQQWWATDPDCYEDWAMQVNGEWRDVPVEKET